MKSFDDFKKILHRIFQKIEDSKPVAFGELEALVELPKLIIQNEHQTLRLLQRNDPDYKIDNLLKELDKAIEEFWKKFIEEFQDESELSYDKLLEYLFPEKKQLIYYKKIWAYNNIGGTIKNEFFKELIKSKEGNEKSNSSDKNNSQKTLENAPNIKIFILLHIYLTIYENFISWLTPFVKKIEESTIREGDMVISRNNIYRIFFRRVFSTLNNRYDEIFDFKLRNTIAHNNLIINNDKIEVLYYGKNSYPYGDYYKEKNNNKRQNSRENKEKKIYDLNTLKMKTYTLYCISTIIITRFDEKIFTIFKNNCNNKAAEGNEKFDYKVELPVGKKNLSPKNNPTYKLFSRYFREYYQAWKQSGKI